MIYLLISVNRTKVGDIGENRRKSFLRGLDAEIIKPLVLLAGDAKGS